jgi:methylglutamate dehydrogenase subunit C
MSRGPQRLPDGGHIDRSRRLSFTFEGRSLCGFAGDSLASALLAQGITLFGRSFKYHRPRGLLGAGVEEPNALMTLGEGPRTTPNIAATVTELYEGLAARRQNGWPSVDFDLMAVNSLLAPLLGAGFYYKTFMGPRRGSWMFYEPFIRRAAGLGRAVHARDPDRYETRYEFADVLVIGAGAAGLAAARSAGACGARVVLAEQDWLLGGQLLSLRASDPLDAWRAEQESALAGLANVRILTRTTALGLYDGNMVALLTRHAGGQPDAARGDARETLTTLCAKAIVFATGAIEQPLVFADNDRPGVLLASAAQTYLNRYAIALGSAIVVATNNDSGWMSAAALARGGASVTVVDQRVSIAGPLLEAARRAGVEVLTGSLVTRALGHRQVRGACITTLAGAQQKTLECDLLCMSGGWAGTVHLTSHTGIKPVYRADIDSFVPGGLAVGHFGAGALTGAFSPGGALHSGAAAGAAAAQHAGLRTPAGDHSAILSPAGAAELPYTVEPARPGPHRPRGKAFVDFQSDVTTRDVASAHQEGFESVEHLKRYTTLGMGTDQGKTSNLNAIGMMSGLRRAGYPVNRHHHLPAAVHAGQHRGARGRTVGQHFRPIRRSPLHDWHTQNGAVFIEAGPWLRAWYYRWAGRRRQALMSRK